MLARIFTEPEVRAILRRYDPKEKWQLDTERSYRDTAIFCEPIADSETDRYMKITYVAPDFLLAERWEGSRYCSVDAVYKKTKDGFKRVFRRRHRKGTMLAGSLFPVTEDASGNGNMGDTVETNITGISKPSPP